MIINEVVVVVVVRGVLEPDANWCERESCSSWEIISGKAGGAQVTLEERNTTRRA